MVYSVKDHYGQEYGYFSVKQSLCRLACHENTKLSDCDSAMNDHLIERHVQDVALVFGNKQLHQELQGHEVKFDTNPRLEMFLQLMVEQSLVYGNISR